MNRQNGQNRFKGVIITQLKNKQTLDNLMIWQIMKTKQSRKIRISFF